MAFFIHGLVCFCIFMHLQTQLNALIIPDEVPTLLSLIYSNIPTLKKGTDSRLGWGFRLGDRADFQVLVELGPQKDTQPLANQGDNANKRQAANSLANALYAQALRHKQQQQESSSVSPSIVSNTNGGKFIQQWSQDMSGTVAVEEPTKFKLGVGEVDAKDFIPENDNSNVIKPRDPLLSLTSLYKKDKEKVTTLRPRTTTSYKDALDNVDLD